MPNFLKKMSFAGMIMKDYFHVEGFALSLVIKKRNFDEKTEAVYTSYYFLQIAIFLNWYLYLSILKRRT